MTTRPARARSARRRRQTVAASLAAAAALSIAPGAFSSTPTSPAPGFAATTVQPGSGKTLTGGEPSLGIDPKTNAYFVGAGTTLVKLAFDDAGNTVAQTNVSPTTALTTLDAITFVDQNTGRIFNSQLAGGCSLTSFSDDDGATWTPSQGCGENTLLDHQSVGGGPWNPNATVPGGVDPLYKDAAYYCAQNGFNATCAVSHNGGLTFGPGQFISNTPTNSVGDPAGGACAGEHGHVKVSADGTVYLPIKGCGGQLTAGDLTNQEYYGGAPAVSVSRDNGTTYTLHTVPGASSIDQSDNSVATDSANRLYMAWQNGSYPVPSDPNKLATTSTPDVAYSTDHGQTWSTPFNLSDAQPDGSPPIKNIQFPEVVAGSAGRAAVSFIGTPTEGDTQHNGFVDPTTKKPAVWHMYVAVTYDGGETWKTTDVTPNNPVQRGCVDLQGTSNRTITDSNICNQRNMLDFNDMSIDRDGRVVIVFAKGCTGACASTDTTTPSHSAVVTVLRQTSGEGMFADKQLPQTTKAAPRVRVLHHAARAHRIAQLAR